MLLKCINVVQIIYLQIIPQSLTNSAFFKRCFLSDSIVRRRNNSAIGELNLNIIVISSHIVFVVLLSSGFCVVEVMIFLLRV